LLSAWRRLRGQRPKQSSVIMSNDPQQCSGLLRSARNDGNASTGSATKTSFSPHSNNKTTSVAKMDNVNSTSLPH
jgi:hypothetical protein